MHAQLEICAKYEVHHVASPPTALVSVTRKVLEGMVPFNGLRLTAKGDHTGWYLWGDECLPPNPPFCNTTVAELDERCSAVIKFLGLPPGWCFDVSTHGEYGWQDSTFLEGNRGETFHRQWIPKLSQRRQLLCAAPGADTCGESWVNPDAAA